MTPPVTAVRCADLTGGYYIEEGHAADFSIWHKISRLLKVLLLLTAVAAIIGAFLPELRTQRADRAKRDLLQEQINAQRRMQGRYERQINWLTNDPEYLETFIREKFDRMKEGETIFRLEDPNARSALSPVLPTAPRRLK